MNKIFKLIKANVVLLLSLVLITACGKRKESELIVVGEFEDQRLAFYKDGEAQGFAVDVINLIAKEINRKVATKSMPLASILNALQNGRVDLAIALIETEERKQNIDFSEAYVYHNLAIAFNKDKNFTSLEDLRGKKVGVILGATAEAFAKSKKDELSLNILSLDKLTLILEAIKSGKIDAAIVLDVQVKSNDTGLQSFIIQGAVDQGIAMGLQKNSPLKPEIDKAIIKLRESGVLDKLHKKWYGY